jgi:enoyl-CoA hydratase
MGDSILYQHDGYIGRLFFNRPEKRNAFNLNMYKKLGELVSEIERKQDIRVLVVSGADDSAFAAGADISEFIESRSSKEKAKHYNDLALGAVEALYRLSVPTIAKIHSFAVGGGLELALACDFRFADESAKLGITAAKLGIVYNLSSTKRLMDVVGPVQAKRLLFTGKLISAFEAKEIGLIDGVFTKADLDLEVEALAGKIAASSPVAVKGSKKVIQAVLDGEVTENESIKELILQSFESYDFKTGVQAFLNKSKPKF